MIIQSRNQFVKQVTGLLRQDRGSGEAYVIGISGKWGEGKSAFLSDLEENLVDARVVWLNPWKYAKDDLSLMRQLLKKLAGLVEDPLVRWQLNTKLKSLYFSSEHSTLSLVNLIVAILVSSIGYLIYRNWHWFHSVVQQNKTVAMVALIPILLAAINAITIKKKSSKSIDTLDQFDDLLCQILEYIPEGKIVIFVDDLDRLTAEKAILVLDSLRTFFDNGRLSFVVAGDHTVLEAHLGRQLMPDKGEPIQLEEGRRFLKKIFNLYWRLPIPTQSEVRGFVNELLDQGNVRGEALVEFLDDRQIEDFKERLIGLYDNNFRQITRFVDHTIFTFQVLESQINNPEIDESKKEFMRDIKMHPLLLIRVLLIEDLVNPWFEKILNDSSFLIDLEKRAYQGDQVDFDSDGSLSRHQRLSISKILASPPGFYGINGLRVKNIGPFIHLSNDPSFGDLRGLSAEDFSAIVQENDLERLKDAIQESGDPKLLEAIQLQFQSSKSDSIERYFKSISTLLRASQQLAAVQNSFHQMILSALNSVNLNKIGEIEQQKKNEFMMVFSDWVEAHAALVLQRSDDITALLDKMAFQIDVSDLQHYQATASSYNQQLLPKTISRILLKWYMTESRKDFASSLGYFSDLIRSISPEAFELEIDGRFIDSFLHATFAQPQSTRDQSVNLLAHFLTTDVHKKTVKYTILTNIPVDKSVWDVAHALNGVFDPHLFEEWEMQAAALSALDALRSADELNSRLQLLSSRITLPDLVNKLWARTIKDYPQFLATIFHAISITGYPAYFAPDNVITNRLLNSTILNSKDKPGQLADILSQITRGNWLLANLNAPNRTLIAGIKRANSEDATADIRTQARRIQAEYEFN